MLAGLGRSVTHAGWRPIEVADRVDLVVTGVGKANAAGAVGAVVGGGKHGWALSIGIAGLLPGGGFELGGAAAIERAVLADEGVETGTGFVSVDQMGFPPIAGGCSLASDARMLEALARIAPRAAVATVSTCSGTDARAAAVGLRTGAGLEDMETAAVALVAARMGVSWGGLRVVSNTTGERSGQRWELQAALEGLRRIIRPAIDGLGAAFGLVGG